MAEESRPYKVVVEALAAQTVAIGRLAKEIKVEFAQYQSAQEAGDLAKANRIAAAINSRTEKLGALADDLASSVPGASPDQGLPEEPPRPGQGLPGGEGPTDPGYGVGSERPSTGPVRPGGGDPDYGVGSERPSTGPVRPGGGDPDYGVGSERPGQGPVRPGGPTDPDYGVGSERPGQGPVRPGGGDPDYGVGSERPSTGPVRPGGGDPGYGVDAPARPGQGLPPTPPVPGQDLPGQRPGVGGGPIEPEGGTKPVDPDEGEIDNTLPDAEGGTKPVEPAEPKPGQQKRSPKG